MAKLTDLPKEHRHIKLRHLDRMPAAEARHRAAHIYGLEQRSPLTGEYQQLTLTHTGRLAAALPVGEYLAQLRHLSDMARRSPATGLDSPKYDFLAASAKLKSENLYVPGLVNACERHLLGREPMYDEADIAAIMGGAEESK